MQYLTILPLLALISPTLAGSAIVKNTCSTPVYLWSVGDGPGAMHTIPPGGSFSEPFRAKGNGGGISLKVSRSTTMYPHEQIEYTVSGDRVFYDLSFIDGRPFKNINLAPDRACPKIKGAGDVYFQPKDDWATKACTIQANIVRRLC